MCGGGVGRGIWSFQAFLYDQAIQDGCSLALCISPARPGPASSMPYLHDWPSCVSAPPPLQLVIVRTWHHRLSPPDITLPHNWLPPPPSGEWRLLTWPAYRCFPCMVGCCSRTSLRTDRLPHSLSCWHPCCWLWALWSWSWANPGLVDLWGAAQQPAEQPGDRGNPRECPDAGKQGRGWGSWQGRMILG